MYIQYDTSSITFYSYLLYIPHFTSYHLIALSLTVVGHSPLRQLNFSCSGQLLNLFCHIKQIGKFTHNIFRILCQRTLSCLPSLVSCLPSPVTLACLPSPTYCLTSHVYRLLSPSPVSSLLSPASRLLSTDSLASHMSPVSHACLLSLVFCLTYPVAQLLSQCLMSPV